MNLLESVVGSDTVPGRQYIANDLHNAIVPVIYGTSSNGGLK